MERKTNETIDWSRMDWNFGDSADSDSRVERAGSSWSHDYWYGRAFFEFHLVRSTFYESHKVGKNCDVSSSLLTTREGNIFDRDGKAAVESLKRDFPYEECAKRLEEVLDITYTETVEDQQDAYSTLMCWIGTGCRVRGQSVEDKIAATLTRFIPGQKYPILSLPLSPPSSVQGRSMSGSIAPVRSTQDHTANSKYSMIWKEWLDQRGGEQPKYEETILSYQPPQFKVSVTYRGQTFTGTGSRKKTAQHEAARQACQAFGIT